MNTSIGAFQMKNPVMTASGTFGYGIEFEDVVDLTAIGGIIDRKSTRLNSSHARLSRMPSSA